jgi:serine/threonine-protein kinase
MLLRPDTLVGGRYRVRAHLGSGGMADVYRAEHVALGRDVALKMLPAARATGDFGARFEREARMAARLAHPACVQVLDSGRSADGARFLAMELIDGPTLRERLSEAGRFGVAGAVRIASELLGGLAHAHALGVLHRDVKPENVMLGTGAERDRVVLIDFGLARAEGQAGLTALGTCVGSPSYVAPERLLGEAADARADLYAVGILLYELLAGERPIAGASHEEIVRRQILARPRPVDELCPDVPPWLAAAVQRALAKEPADRFSDADAMRQALVGGSLPALPTSRMPARTSDPEQTTTQFARPRPRGPALGVTL